MEPRPAGVKTADKQMPEDYGPLPRPTAENIVPVKFSEDPKSLLNYYPKHLNWREFPLREMLSGLCWPEADVPAEGSLIRAKGAWYDLQSDAPVDGSQDRAECPTKFWKVISCCQLPPNCLKPDGPDGPPYSIDAAGQFIEQYV